ncbi:MAG: M20/M25/M40 family metallo-hydrolase, partial [Acidimicrobiia bacterium]
MVKMLGSPALLLFLTATILQSQKSGVGLGPSVESFVASHQKAIVSELITLLSVPNVAGDSANIRQNALLLREMLTRRGFQADLLETSGNPLVYGELRVPSAQRTVLIYSHYDGQPVDPARWKQDSPFKPVLREGRLEDGAKLLSADQVRFDPDWRLYARSASDDKSPIVALCTALDALKAAGRAPSSNLRVILDGEEEAGSRSLVPAIAKYRDRLAADLMLIFDGPVHPSEKPTVVFGARGNLAMELTVYGPKFGLHSGHYGNWIPNPAMRLAHLLASLKDEEGHVLVEGFYDGLTLLSGEEQSMLEAVPDDEPGLLKFFGVAEPEQKGLSLQAALQ